MPNEDLFPPAPEGAQLIHTRQYEVRTYKMADDRFILRGVVSDEKPAGLYVSGDPDPLRMHHMIVDLEVAFPSFQITAVRVDFKAHPHTLCTDITDDYQQLVGLSIARGFTAKVKELFGGPRGCTHVGALLAAMAPVAIQSGWSMRAGTILRNPSVDAESIDEQRKRAFAQNLNTCHMWREDGSMATSLREGTPIEVPLPVQRRLANLGRSLEEWTSTPPG